MKIMLATFALVFLRGIQQQNVIHGNYITAAITPYFIAIAEVASVLWVVDIGWPAVPWVGTGGALGVTAAMVLHRRYLRKHSTELKTVHWYETDEFKEALKKNVKLP